MDEHNEKEIVIKFTSRLVERLIYIVIIIALILLVVFNPLNIGKDTPTTQVSSDNTETEANGEEEKAEVTETVEEEEETNTTVEEEDEEAEVTETVEEETNTTEEEEVDTSDLSGIATILVSGVNMDADSDNKIKSVGFIIDNQKEDFIPKVEAFWYDTADTSAVKEKLKGEWSASATLKAGTKVSGTISPNDDAKKYMGGSKFYVTVKLYDLAEDELLDTELYVKEI